MVVLLTVVPRVDWSADLVVKNSFDASDWLYHHVEMEYQLHQHVVEQDDDFAVVAAAVDEDRGASSSAVNATDASY